MTSSNRPNSVSSLSVHTQPVEQTIQILETHAEQGLSTQEAQQRLQHYGKNEIEEGPGTSAWIMFFDQFKDVMLILLIVVAIISGTLDLINLLQEGAAEGEIPFKDTIAIMLIVILNGVLGYLQESRAEKALAALKRLSSPQVRVIRDGQPMEIEAPDLVPGDIMLPEAGSQLCADGQIIMASNFQVRESALTGESHAVNKHPETGLEADTPLGDRINMVFTGTEVVQGRAKIVVTGTAMDTELGKIAQMLQEVEAEPTPLQQRMNQLGNALVTGSVMLVVLVIAIGIIQTGFSRLQELVEVSLSMAVAVVPEGLPAVVTVTLALGTQRMVKRHALIRKLPAVETLGSVNAICSDKTGTLTQNKMVVQEVSILDRNYKVTGEGYAPIGEFFLGDQSITLEKTSALYELLTACILCNDAVLKQPQEDSSQPSEWSILGDPTEGALLSLAGKGGLEQTTINRHWTRLGEFPFSSERKRMSVICEHHQENLLKMFTKGSPELILERCQEIHQGSQSLILTEEHRRQILHTNDQMAERGLRVLGFAYRSLQAVPPADSDQETEKDLIWLGLVGMLDAPRSEVLEAVKRSKAAGIRPVMITGDHQLTARAIAQQLGIAQEGDRVLTGQELERLSQQELEQEVHDVSIYARVSPEHKLRIVQALQKEGKFTAMTGDGVNDAPALKQADIGIAMGITGTDVSKEASDMVLLDDNFATIVAATEEGRVVYDNIRRFIKYILGSNVGELITIAAAPLMGLPEVPLVPLQILWMNLVTDGLPALALAVEPAEPDVMNRPAYGSRESVFARGLGSYIIRIGIIFAIITIALMVFAYDRYPAHWKTIVFTSLCISQMGHAIAVRSNSQLTLELNPFSNPYLLAAVVGTTGLQFLLVYTPSLRNFFGTTTLTLEELALCVGFSSLIFIWVELEKLFVRWFLRNKQ